MKFPVGSVGVSHCGFGSRGRTFPSLQQVFPSRCAPTEQRVQVFVTEKTRRCSEGVTLRMGLRRGGEPTLVDPEGSCTYSTVVTSEGVAVALPIRPVTYTSILLQNHVLFLYRRLLSLALAVFPRCSPHMASLPAASQVCPRRGGKLGTLPTAFMPGGLRLVSTFFYCRMDAKVDWRTMCMCMH